MEYEIVADYGTLQVIQSENGLFGLLMCRELYLKPEFAEITRFPGADYVYCRNIGLELFIGLDGSKRMKRCEPHATKDDEPVGDGLVKTCNGYKYGLSTDTGEEILPIEYDQIDRWPDCEVIYLRKGTKFRYIDLKGNEILRKVRHIKGATDTMTPYYVGEPQSNIIQMMDLRDEPFGNDFCTCYGRRAGLSRRTREEHLEQLTDIAPNLGKEAREGFMADDAYIFASYVVQARHNCENPLLDCIIQLREMGQFQSTWSWVFVIVYSDADGLNMRRDRWLCQCLSDDCGNQEIHDPGFATSHSLAKDGMVLIATRYFCDHWPTEKDWKEWSVGQYDNMRELKRIFRPGRNRTLLDTAMENVLERVNQPWHRQRRMLEFLYRRGARLSKNVLNLTIAFNNREYARRSALLVDWLMAKGVDVNASSLCRTALDCMNEKFANRYPDIAAQIKRSLLTAGAKTFEEIRSEESKRFGFHQNVKLRK